MGMLDCAAILDAIRVQDGSYKGSPELEFEFSVVFHFNDFVTDAVKDDGKETHYMRRIKGATSHGVIMKIMNDFCTEYKSNHRHLISLPGVEGCVELGYDRRFEWETGKNLVNKEDLEDAKQAARNTIAALLNLDTVMSEGVRTFVQDQDAGHEKGKNIKFHYANGPIDVKGKSFNATVVIKRNVKTDRFSIYQVQTPSYYAYDGRVKSINKMGRVGKDGVIINGKVSVSQTKKRRT